MSGTTLCPHCNTRFRIAGAQLESHQGMVRCGHCLQAFDARPEFIPDQPDPQLELPMLDQPAASAAQPSTDEAHAPETPAEALTEEPEEPATTPPADSLDFSQPHPVYAAPADEAAKPQAADQAETQTLAEQVAIVPDEEPTIPPKRRTWPWAIAAFVLLLALLAQAAYFFRVEIAARQPGLKPALTAYCQLLGCSVPLPQQTEWMSIESSDLEADPAHENRIVLHALLRNRAPYAQAFPSLELTLNDTQDKPMARRIFHPADYLTAGENEKQGLAANRDLDIKLHLDTTDIKPIGYRLVLFYPTI